MNDFIDFAKTALPQQFFNMVGLVDTLFGVHSNEHGLLYGPVALSCRRFDLVL